MIFLFLVDTGSSITGSGNTVSSLLNVNPHVNADVNALNAVNQKAIGISGGAVSGRAAGRTGNNIGGSQVRKYQTALLVHILFSSTYVRYKLLLIISEVSKM